MAKYLRHYEKVFGKKDILQIGDGDLELTNFSIISLSPQQKIKIQSENMENVVIVLEGVCSLSCGDFSVSEFGGRKNVFSGKPHTVLIPANSNYLLESQQGAQIALVASPSSLDIEPYEIKPESIKEVHLGKDNYQRDAYLILTEENPSSHLFIGEAFVPSGNHASFPPHRHDFDNLPYEVDMEEIYFFRFDSQQGYGIQKIYNDDGSINETYTVRNNDVTLLPEGYHPVINAPGYTMYYLWIMAGKNNRKFLSVIDPMHKWMMDK